MLKIQEIEFDGVTLRVREPRLRDYLNSKKASPDEFIVVMLGGMLVNEDGSEFGREKVEELPLRVFDRLSLLVQELTTPSSAPLDQKIDSSIGSV